MSAKVDGTSQDISKEVEWEVNLPQRERWRLESPEFSFEGLKYKLWVYTDYLYPERIRLQFDMQGPFSASPLRVIQWQVGVKHCDGTGHKWTERCEIPVEGVHLGWRFVDKWKIFELSELKKEKEAVAPNGRLTFILRLSKGQVPTLLQSHTEIETLDHRSYKKAVQKVNPIILTSDIDTHPSNSPEPHRNKRKRIQCADVSSSDEDNSTKPEEILPCALNSLSKVIDLTEHSEDDLNNSIHSVCPLKSTSGHEEIKGKTQSTKDSDRASLNVEFQNIVLQKLDAILHKMKAFENKLEMIENDWKMSRESVEWKNESFSTKPEKDYFKLLPLATESSLHEIEDELQRKGIVDLVSCLRVIGGSSEQDCVTRILKRVLTNDVAENYSWSGCKGNKIFKDLYLAKAIFRAAQNHFPSLSEKTAERIIANWLKYAKQRKQRFEEKCKKREKID